MNVDSIQLYKISPAKIQNRQNIEPKEEEKTINEPHQQKVYAYHLGFRGGTQLTALMNDYKWFINCDKIPAINSFLKINASKEEMFELLKNILRNHDLSYEFVDSIVKQPRNRAEIHRALKEKLPYGFDMNNSYDSTNLYPQAYEHYIEKRIAEANSVDELLKIRPDWKSEVLINKQNSINQGKSLEFGSIPYEIGAENFDPLVNYLQQYVQRGMKSQQEVPDFNINGKTFKFKRFIEGRSDKNIFGVETPNGTRFVIKIAPEENKGINVPNAMGTTCIVDAYLTQNNCRNSAPIRYYNHDKNTAIYDKIKHEKVQQIRYDMNSLRKYKIPDMDNLGIQQNDTVGANNYFQLSKNQTALKNSHDFKLGAANEEFISVDNDHASYSQIFSPKIEKYFKDLPQGTMQMFH